MQAGVHAHYVLAFMGPYLSQIGMDQRDQITMESEDHAGPLWALTSPRQCQLVCMHPRCLCAQAHISAKLGWIREIKVSINQKNISDLSEHMIWPKNGRLHTCTLFACMHRPISQPNLVRLERLGYVWNSENIQDLSEYIIHPKHTS